MEVKKLSEQTRRIIRGMQQTECTEAATYRAAAEMIKDENNQKILLRLSAEETAHYQTWRAYTGEDMKPQAGKLFWRKLLIRLLGFTFAVKLMENREDVAKHEYAKLAEEAPEALAISAQEDAHEQALMEMLDEERLQYVGSMVLGMNDALVELTGTLAGLTLAMQNTRIIALSGLITGISATLSMASSEYLSSKSEGREDALKSAVYTGVAYLVTVALLVLPYLLFPDDMYLYALFTMVAIVIVVIAAFNYYLAVAKDLSFRSRFLQMAGVSLGVATLAFFIGLLVKQWLGVDI